MMVVVVVVAAAELLHRQNPVKLDYLHVVVRSSHWDKKDLTPWDAGLTEQLVEPANL
jgi:hypothetical protein